MACTINWEILSLSINGQGAEVRRTRRDQGGEDDAGEEEEGDEKSIALRSLQGCYLQAVPVEKEAGRTGRRSGLSGAPSPKSQVPPFD